MSEIGSIIIAVVIVILTIRFFIAQNRYEKILSFYFIFTNAIILILINSITNFDNILDIIIVLSLLKLITILALLFRRQI